MATDSQSPLHLNGSADLLGESGAELSDCGHYRYRLWRQWAEVPPVLFVMLNPSTADATQDDPTIRRCIGYAKRWGRGGIIVANLYAWRATKPADLHVAQGPVGEYPVIGFSGGPENRNDKALEEAALDADLVIAAWGADPGPIRHRPAYVLELLRRRCEIKALGLTKHGQPRHPLYMRADAEPVLYRERAS